MGCGCGGGKNNSANQQRVRANLQAVRKPFVPPAPTPQVMLQPTVSPQQPVSATDRRRIQKLNQEAVRRSLNHH
jgi:hypothetical protein